MKSTFLPDDVTVLLKDVSNTVKTEMVETREKLIRNGSKAYDMVPFEDVPSHEEFSFYEKALEISAYDTALAVRCVAEKIYEKKGKDIVLVSLARGGIPAGILIKRYLDKKYEIKIPHYAITLIGTMGIDEEALKYILKRYEPSRIQFVDGWTGKGAINRALDKALKKFDKVSSELAVLADPANMLNLCGTREDILIASACLNAPLVGLISRAIPLCGSFFGAVFFDKLIDYDKTYNFINNIESKMDYSEYKRIYMKNDYNGLAEVKSIANEFRINDIHFIKPGLGESVRALIRKKPDVILVRNENDKYIELVKEVAAKNNILIKDYPLLQYKVCSIYKDSNSDVL